MNEMEDWELNDIVDNLTYLDRNSWEQTRLNLNTSIWLKSRKKVNVTDFIKFPWDTETINTNIDKKDIRRLKEKSNEIYNKYIKKNG